MCGRSKDVFAIRLPGNDEFGQAECKSTERKNVDDGGHKNSAAGKGGVVSAGQVCNA